MTNKHFTFTLFGLLCLAFYIPVCAQKLPSVQLSSVRAPQKVKVDGNLNEWNRQFEAFNSSTEVYYTLANDNGNLYFTLQPKDAVIAKKIMAGGITITLNSSGKKDQNGISVTFPIVAGSAQNRLGMLLSEPAMAADSVGKRRQTDSLMRLLNAEFNSAAKEIKVTGVKAIPDSMLSVYNDSGIKVAAFFDNKRVLTYELAVPIKYLEFLQHGESKLQYQLMLNGLISVFKMTTHQTSQGTVLVQTVPRGMNSGGSSAGAVINYPTDFWGAYTLAK